MSVEPLCVSASLRFNCDVFAIFAPLRFNPVMSLCLCASVVNLPPVPRGEFDTRILVNIKNLSRK